MGFNKPLSDNAIENLEFLGSFSPTVNPSHKMIKGYLYDGDEGEVGRVYLEPSDLRALASACNEVAEWLEERAASDVR